MYTDPAYGILNGFKTKNFLYESELYGTDEGEERTIVFSENDPCVNVRGRSCTNPQTERNGISKLQFISRDGHIEPDWTGKYTLDDELPFNLPFGDTDRLAGLAGFSISEGLETLGVAGAYKEDPGYSTRYTPVVEHMPWPPRYPDQPVNITEPELIRCIEFSDASVNYVSEFRDPNNHWLAIDKYLWNTDNKNELVVYDCTTGDEVYHSPRGSSYRTDLAFLRDEPVLLYSSSDRITRFDLRNEETVTLCPGENFYLSDDQTVLHVMERQNSNQYLFKRYRFPSLSLIDIHNVGEISPHKTCRVSNDATTLAIAGGYKKLHLTLHNLLTGEARTVINSAGHNGIYSPVFSKDDRYIYTGGGVSDGGLYEYDRSLDQWKKLVRPHGNYVENVLLYHNDTFLISGGMYGGIKITRRGNDDTWSKMWTSDKGSGARVIRIGPDGTTVAFCWQGSGETGGVAVYKLK